MTLGDFQFMKEIGIEPSGLDDPFPGSLPPPPPPKLPIPKLAEEDSRWLEDLRVAWEHEVEPDFVPPKTLPEYLARFPTGIREAVGEVARGTWDFAAGQRSRRPGAGNHADVPRFCCG